MSRQWCGGILLSIFFAGALLAQQDRGVEPVSKKNSDGSVSGALAGETINLGIYHALLIGISQYQHPEFAPNLSTPLNDIYNMRDLLIRHYGFNNENVKLLLDGQATRTEILHALTFYRDAPLGSSDNLLVYFAGHGFQHPGTEDGFWIPSDATTDESTWVSVSEIRRIVRSIKAKHTLIISDSCFSGTLTRATLALPTHDRFLAEVFKKDSYQALTSGGLEPVADGGKDGMSLFAYSLSSYLKSTPRSYFTASQLYTDLAPIVANASGSRQTPEHGKIPGTFDQNGQFVFTRIDMGGSMPTPPPPAPEVSPKPISTLAPITAPAVLPGTVAFLDITFAQPKGWEVVKNQPGESLEYKDPQSGFSIALSSFHQDSVDALLKNPAAMLKTMSTNFVKGFKEKGFTKVELANTEQRPVGEFHVFSWDLTYQLGPISLWSRADLVVDAKSSRVYNFTTTGEPSKKGAAIEALRQIIPSLQRAGR